MAPLPLEMATATPEITVKMANAKVKIITA